MTLFDLQDGEKFTYKGETFTLVSIDDQSGTAVVTDQRGNETYFNAYAEIEVVA